MVRHFLQLVSATVFCVSLALAAQPTYAKSYKIRSVDVEFIAKDQWMFPETNLGIVVFEESRRIADPREFGLTEGRVIRDLEAILSSVLVDASKDRRISVDAKVIITYFNFSSDDVNRCKFLSENCVRGMETAHIACQIYLLDSNSRELLKKKRVSTFAGAATVPRAYKETLIEIAQTARRKLIR